MDSNSSKRTVEVKLHCSMYKKDRPTLILGPSAGKCCFKLLFFDVYFSSLGVLGVSSTSLETGKWTRNFYTVSEWKKKGPTHISDRFTKEGWEVQYKVLAMSPHTTSFAASYIAHQMLLLLLM